MPWSTPMYLVTGYAILFVLRLLERRFAVRALSMLEPIALRRCPFLVQGPARHARRSPLLVVVAVAGRSASLLGVGLVYGPAAAALAGARLQRHHPRHPDPGADLLRLLRAAGARAQPASLRGGGARAHPVHDGAGDRDHARRAPVDPSRPDRGRQGDRADLRAAARLRHLPAGAAPLPAALDQQRHRRGQGQRAGLAASASST